ncbi:hypothetical protein SDJN03_11669, partial [Cucurbita argyrosperma subsp. sororia]
MGLGKAVSQVTLSFSRGGNDSFNSLSKFVICARSTLTALSATPSSLEVGLFFLLHSQPLSLIQVFEKDGRC